MRFFGLVKILYFVISLLKFVHPLQVSEGVELLGAPIFGSDQYFNDFTAALFDKVKHLQDLLPELEDPQIELQLLRHCLSCCKVVHVLYTVPPHLLHNLSRFDDQLRSSLFEWLGPQSLISLGSRLLSP